MKLLAILLSFGCGFPLLTSAQMNDSVPPPTIDFILLNSIGIQCSTIEKVIDSALTLSSQHPNNHRILSYSMSTLKRDSTTILISLHSEHFDVKNKLCLGVLQYKGKNIFCMGESLQNVLFIDSTQQTKVPCFQYHNEDERLFDSMLLDERLYLQQELWCNNRKWNFIVEYLPKGIKGG